LSNNREADALLPEVEDFTNFIKCGDVPIIQDFWNSFIVNSSPFNRLSNFNVAYEKYSRLVSNNPELRGKDIKHIDDFKDVNLENKRVEHFKSIFYGL